VNVGDHECAHVGLAASKHSAYPRIGPTSDGYANSVYLNSVDANAPELQHFGDGRCIVKARVESSRAAHSRSSPGARSFARRSRGQMRCSPDVHGNGRTGRKQLEFFEHSQGSVYARNVVVSAF